MQFSRKSKFIYVFTLLHFRHYTPNAARQALAGQSFCRYPGCKKQPAGVLNATFGNF
jgi:hypothetical protein